MYLVSYVAIASYLWFSFSKDYCFVLFLQWSNEVPRPRGDRKSYEPGQAVNFLLDGESVGRGTIMEGSILHGQDVPKDHKKLMVNSVQPNIHSVFATAFDEDSFISSGQFIAWPTAHLSPAS